MGISWEDIFMDINRGQSQLRMAVMHSEDGAMIIDDTYNASPESVMDCIKPA
jgi:UDP-N-acetylmuramoyl-tripeptide--D-alanyl-D-alanine ligase